MLNPVVRGALGAAVLLLAPTAFVSAAVAHATLETTKATPNSSYKGIVKVNHGCGESPTVKVTVTIPEGVIAVRPMPKPGWTIDLAKGSYARTYSFHGRELTEGVKSITWQGGSLPSDFYDEFVFVGRITDAFADGSTAYFPVTQQCASGSHDWSEIPAAGQASADLKSPAPGVRIAQAAAMGLPTTMPAPIKAGDLTITAAWTRATPAGAKVAGGYLAVANTGKSADRLIGGAFDIAGEVQIHEMSMDGGVMKMRPLDKGLEIAPGATVMLKPGGYHIMFMGLKQPLKAGETIKGTLTFEKAGIVPVSFTVGGIGDRQAPGGDHH